MEEFLVIVLALARRALQRFGPYLLIELLLPGGTLIALALYALRGKIGRPMSIWRSAERQ